MQGIVADVEAGSANRLEAGVEQGAEVEQRMRNPLWDTITVAGRLAARELNEIPPEEASQHPEV